MSPEEIKLARNLGYISATNAGVGTGSLTTNIAPGLKPYIIESQENDSRGNRIMPQEYIHNLRGSPILEPLTVIPAYDVNRISRSPYLHPGFREVSTISGYSPQVDPQAAYPQIPYQNHRQLINPPLISHSTVGGFRHANQNLNYQGFHSQPMRHMVVPTLSMGQHFMSFPPQYNSNNYASQLPNSCYQGGSTLPGSYYANNLVPQAATGPRNFSWQHQGMTTVVPEAMRSGYYDRNQHRNIRASSEGPASRVMVGHHRQKTGHGTANQGSIQHDGTSNRVVPIEVNVPIDSPITSRDSIAVGYSGSENELLRHICESLIIRQPTGNLANLLGEISPSKSEQEPPSVVFSLRGNKIVCGDVFNFTVTSSSSKEVTRQFTSHRRSVESEGCLTIAFPLQCGKSLLEITKNGEAYEIPLDLISPEGLHGSTEAFSISVKPLNVALSSPCIIRSSGFVNLCVNAAETTEIVSPEVPTWSELEIMVMKIENTESLEIPEFIGLDSTRDIMCILTLGPYEFKEMFDDWRNPNEEFIPVFRISRSLIEEQNPPIIT